MMTRGRARGVSIPPKNDDVIYEQPLTGRQYISTNDISERKNDQQMISLGGKIDQQTFQACLQKIERVNTVYTAPEKVNSSLLLL